MSDFDVIGRINELCKTHSWSYYRLAKESGIPYSTLNTMLHKTYVPTVPSLMKICDGFGITLAELFNEDTEVSILTEKERELVENFRTLPDHKAESLLNLSRILNE